MPFFDLNATKRPSTLASESGILRRCWRQRYSYEARKSTLKAVQKTNRKGARGWCRRGRDVPAVPAGHLRHHATRPVRILVGVSPLSHRPETETRWLLYLLLVRRQAVSTHPGWSPVPRL